MSSKLGVPRAAVVLAGAVALAAVSLLLPRALAFDPWAWLVWGREIGRLSLDTSSGPSWKPFPALFTTPFALFDGAAPLLWLLVARTGGILAVAGAFVLAARLGGGTWAGVAGAAALALSPWWLYNTALGNSEGLLAAAVLWAIVAHLAGRPRAALALGTAAALMRPEVWPFLAAYGVWLWRADRRPVVVSAVIVPLLWLGPDVFGTGGALNASNTARGVPSPGSAKLEPVPLLALLGDAAELLTVPALIAALVAVVVGDRSVRWIAAGAAAWVAIVAALTLGGFAGNPRYLAAAAAVAAALAGVGATARFRRAGAAALIAVVFAVTGATLAGQLSELRTRADAAGEFDGVIAAAGGSEAQRGCSRIRTSIRARSFVAWRLDLPLSDLDDIPERPSVVIRAKWFYGLGLEPPLDPGYRVLATSAFWQVAAACGPKVKHRIKGPDSLF